VEIKKMKLISTKDEIVSIEFSKLETMLIRNGLNEIKNERYEQDALANEDNVDVVYKMFDEFFRQDVSHERSSKGDLSGDQLNIIKVMLAEILKIVPQSEFSMRLPANEDEVFQMLKELKSIQGESGVWGKARVH